MFKYIFFLSLLYALQLTPTRNDNQNHPKPLPEEKHLKYFSEIMEGHRLGRIQCIGNKLTITCQGVDGSVTFTTHTINKDEALKMIPKHFLYRENLAAVTAGTSESHHFEHVTFRLFAHLPVKEK